MCVLRVNRELTVAQRGVWGRSKNAMLWSFLDIVRLSSVMLLAFIDPISFLPGCSLTATLTMIELIKSDTFEQWLLGLRDRAARIRIQVRLDRFASGNPGDVKPVREGLFEMRVDYGPGYRVYFIRRGPVVVLLLAGGDKSSQERDIERALEIAKEWRD